MAKGDKLSKKQKGFVKDYVKTGNGTFSALNNYDTDNPKTASVIATENLAKPIIQKAIQSFADRISDDKLEQVLNEGLDATKTIVADGSMSMEADYSTRHKYLDTAAKIKGLYAPEKKKIEYSEELIEAIKGRVNSILE